MFSEVDLNVIQAEFSILNKNYLIVMSKHVRGTVLQLINLHNEGEVELEFNLDDMIGYSHKDLFKKEFTFVKFVSFS